MVKNMATIMEEKQKITQNEFLEKIREIQNQIAGYDNLGGHTEYYDEDGVVLMESNQLENGMVEIRFSNNPDEVYNFNLLKANLY